MYFNMVQGVQEIWQSKLSVTAHKNKSAEVKMDCYRNKIMAFGNKCTFSGCD